MQSLKLVQSGLEDLKRITRADFYLCDESIDELINTFDQIVVDKDIIAGFIQSSADSQNIKGYYYQKVSINPNENLILIVYAGGNDGYMISRIAASEILHLMGTKSANEDKEEFFRDLVLDNILPGEIEKRARKLKIHGSATRVVYYILVEEEFQAIAFELLVNIFSENKEDIVLKMSEGYIAVVKTISSENDEDINEVVDENAQLIVSMINTELMIKAKVTYGRYTTELKRLSECYKEASMALEVASIFYEERNIASYTSLGIGRLIHQLPEGLCRLFLDEVLGENADRITDEEKAIIDTFFENNLNVAETARELEINRTTLIYRLDKLAKKLNLDVRKFEDALVLKVAMMVAKYVKYLEKV